MANGDFPMVIVMIFARRGRTYWCTVHDLEPLRGSVCALQHTTKLLFERYLAEVSGWGVEGTQMSDEIVEAKKALPPQLPDFLVSPSSEGSDGNWSRGC